MGLDLDQLFGSAKEAISQGMNDVLKQGGNAAIGYLEGEAIAILAADKADKEKAFQEGVAQILTRPSSSNSFGAYVQNVAQSPIIKEYGGYIIAGAAVVAIVVLFNRG